MATDKPRFLVTPSADLKKEWEKAAKEEGKSLSKWVIDMVEKARSVNPVATINLEEKQKGDHGYYEKEVVTRNGSFIQLEMPFDELDEKEIKEIEDSVACPRCMNALLVNGVCPACGWDDNEEPLQETPSGDISKAGAYQLVWNKEGQKKHLLKSDSAMETLCGEWKNWKQSMDSIYFCSGMRESTLNQFCPKCLDTLR